MSQKTLNVSQLAPNPSNPRHITDDQLAALGKAMREFGDLSGLVFNKATGNLVGGHQRIKILKDAPVTILKRYRTPSKRGTVSEGFVSHGGEHFTYREVRWKPAQEKAAMIAANKQGGEFDTVMLKEILTELKEGDLDMELTGFYGDELDEMLAKMSAPEDFPTVDSNIAIQHKCPKCGYEWSGKPA